jgi:hypothetical protein
MHQVLVIGLPSIAMLLVKLSAMAGSFTNGAGSPKPRLLCGLT